MKKEPVRATSAVHDIATGRSSGARDGGREHLRVSTDSRRFTPIGLLRTEERPTSTITSTSEAPAPTCYLLISHCQLSVLAFSLIPPSAVYRLPSTAFRFFERNPPPTASTIMEAIKSSPDSGLQTKERRLAKWPLATGNNQLTTAHPIVRCQF